MQCGDSPSSSPAMPATTCRCLHEAADEGRIAGENAALYPDVRLRAPPHAARHRLLPTRSSRSSGRGSAISSRARSSPARCRSRTRGEAASCCATSGSSMFTPISPPDASIGAEMIGPDAEHLGHLLAGWHGGGVHRRADPRDAVLSPGGRRGTAHGALRDAAGKLRRASRASCVASVRPAAPPATSAA